MNEGGLGAELRVQLGRAALPAAERRGRARHAGRGRAPVVPRGQRLRVAARGARGRAAGGRRAARPGRRRGLRRAGHPRLHPGRRVRARLRRRRRAVVVRGRRPGGVRAAVPRAWGCETGPARSRSRSTSPPASGSATPRARACAGVSGYFEQLPDAANTAFLGRYRRAFGAFAPPVSSISESAYEAVHLYAAAARQAGEDEPRTVARELRRSRGDFPRGIVTVTGPETVDTAALPRRSHHGRASRSAPRNDPSTRHWHVDGRSPAVPRVFPCPSTLRMTPPCAASTSATGSGSPTPTSPRSVPFVEGLLASWDAVEELYAASRPAMPERAWSRPDARRQPVQRVVRHHVDHRVRRGPAGREDGGGQGQHGRRGRADDERRGDDGGLHAAARRHRRLPRPRRGRHDHRQGGLRGPLLLRRLAHLPDRARSATRGTRRARRAGRPRAARRS